MFTQRATILLGAFALTGIAGCASQAAGTASTPSKSVAVPAASAVAANENQDRTVAEQQQRIAALERDLNAARQQPAKPIATESQLFPPNPKAGECYARVLTPAQYKTETETVMTRAASERVEIIPARYEAAEERVLVKEASTRIETIPATYETVEERVMVRPAATRIEEVPATYNTVSEQVLVAPARTEWKRGPAASFSRTGVVLDSQTTDTGEIMCLVEIPAVYKTVTRRVIDKPATSRTIEVPAQYTVVKKQVVKTPASTREISVPAEYRTVTASKVATPAQERRIEIPATYETVSKRTKIGEEKLEWRRVVCEVNLTAANVSTLQRGLHDKGHYDGPIDGKLGTMTLRGANDFARKQDLPAGSNYITVEVASALGLKL
jgi:hypothetical protein